MSRDRVTLLLAYLLLVTVTAWSSWDTGRTLDRIEGETCAVAGALLLTAAVEISGQIDDEPLSDQDSDALTLAIGFVTQACGIDDPSVVVPPVESE